MLIHDEKIDIFSPFINVKIVTVNKVGVAGKGLALEFKKRYRRWFSSYKTKCDLGLIKNELCDFNIYYGCWIFNFCSKNHWKNPSNLGLIEDGAIALYDSLKLLNNVNVGLPKVGCQNGQLNWNDVKPILDKHLSDLPDDIKIYYL